MIQVTRERWLPDRSLKFSATSDRVAAGAGTSLDNGNLQQGSFASWGTIGVLTANHRFFQKGIAAVSANFFNIQLTNLRFFISINRPGGVDQDARADFAAFPGVFNPAGLQRNPVFCAGTWDLTTTANNRLFAGNLVMPPREPNFYVGQTAGSGSQITNTTEIAYIGNNKNFNVPYVGDMSFYAMWDRVLNPNEFALLWKNPLAIRDSSCKLLYLLGDSGAAATQTDLSGNGNHGTVTGPTQEGFRMSPSIDFDLKM